jgi:hypothetical protein
LDEDEEKGAAWKRKGLTDREAARSDEEHVQLMEVSFREDEPHGDPSKAKRWKIHQLQCFVRKGKKSGKKTDRTRTARMLSGGWKEKTASDFTPSTVETESTEEH